MSDNYLTVSPTDPYWRPGKDAADRAVALLSGMLPDDDARRGLEAKWHDSVEMVLCGANLEKISCPRCGAECSPGWWGEAVSERCNEGFSTLMVTVLCCAAARTREDTPARLPLPDDTAYVIYTSCSAGSPKGCMVGHSQVPALMDAAVPLLGTGPRDVWTLFHSLSFDFSVRELWGSLLYGGQRAVNERRTR
ncbi:AMP-binding protein [Streptomyces sp. GESEQ-35]|uniref:AMP-binding protein n=1 Tax=Streptomyces sp. GESEQ-35 TaxID=2812657 RepID=UPI001B343ADF|nr:AMP-binding protein [Streptomyces sp. GESEQ-35]